MNYELITAVRSFAGRAWEELTIVSNSSGATIIFLQSHPRWIAAQRQARERSESMRRHPSSRLCKRAPISSGDVTPDFRDFKLHTSTDTPA
ncbi:hypothetical protein [Mycobacterium sp.]|uniref:hypothetical protein n=1 Tax=Mycobacterium sp. TaxID=1785 RepID=UPI003F9BD046